MDLQKRFGATVTRKVLKTRFHILIIFCGSAAGKVFRLLEVDNRLFVPTNTHIRVLVTSADVLHSWAVPSLGIKVDATIHASEGHTETN